MPANKSEVTLGAHARKFPKSFFGVGVDFAVKTFSTMSSEFIANARDQGTVALMKEWFKLKGLKMKGASTKAKLIDRLQEILVNGESAVFENLFLSTTHAYIDGKTLEAYPPLPQGVHVVPGSGVVDASVDVLAQGVVTACWKKFVYAAGCR